MINNFRITEKGINSVLIIDDDAKDDNYTVAKLKSEGFKEIIDQLEDDTNQYTRKIIDILKTDKPEPELQDLINFIFEPFNTNVPDYFQQKLLNPAKEKFQENYKKIEIVIEVLISLGIVESAINKAKNIDEANKLLEINFPDLILIDFRLEDEGTNSINFIEDLIKRIKKETLSTQLILTSYDLDGLKNNFRDLHRQNKISSSRLKVIAKPKTDDDFLYWKFALFQIANEKIFMNEQEQMQGDIARCIEKASDKLIEKIWEMDACYLNQLSLVAQEDHISLQKYLFELMSKNLLAEYEEQISENDSIQKFEKALKSVENNNLIFSSSWEITDPYENLKTLFADLVSFRYKSIEKPYQNFNNQELNKNNFKDYLALINFGTILKLKGQKNKQGTENNQYYINLTIPCDYIHSEYNNGKKEKLIFIPGKEYDPLNSFTINNKEAKSQHLHIKDCTGTKSLKWLLRQPETFSINDVLQRLINKEFVITGQLRQEQAQAIITKFATNISRIGLPRTPIFDYSKTYCFNIEELVIETETKTKAKGEGETKAERKGETKTKNDKNTKILKEILEEKLENSTYTVRKYYNKNDMNIVFSHKNSMSILNEIKIELTENEKKDILSRFMGGITLKKEQLYVLLDKKILLCTLGDFINGHKDSELLKEYIYIIIING